MTKREIYLEAARRIAEYEELFSCCAISFVNSIARKPGNLNERLLYERVMSPVAHDVLHVSAIGGDRDLRVWLLCMMAAACNDFSDATPQVDATVP